MSYLTMGKDGPQIDPCSSEFLGALGKRRKKRGFISRRSRMHRSLMRKALRLSPVGSMALLVARERKRRRRPSSSFVQEGDGAEEVAQDIEYPPIEERTADVEPVEPEAAEPESSVDGYAGCGGYIVSSPSPAQTVYSRHSLSGADELWYEPEWVFEQHEHVSDWPPAGEAIHAGSPIWGGGLGSPF